MKKKREGLRAEYDLSQLKGGVRGKFYRQATAGTHLVLIEPELAEVFPDTEAVNRALRLLVGYSGGGDRYRRRGGPNKPLQPTRAAEPNAKRPAARSGPRG